MLDTLRFYIMWDFIRLINFDFSIFNLFWHFFYKRKFQNWENLYTIEKASFKLQSSQAQIIRFSLIQTTLYRNKENSYFRFVEHNNIIKLLNLNGFNNIIKFNMESQKKTALKILEETSRTFYIPIVKLPTGAQQAVASAYLCLRAIDEVEDHPKLDNLFKAKILRDISYGIQKYKPYSTAEDMKFNWHGQEQLLPEVSLRLAEWIYYCPESFRARVADSTGSMADRMAFWAERNWKVEDESDLDAYTFAVAGAVGLILCQIWEWYQGTKTDRDLAIGYGRGLQSVNILRNGDEDAVRGVTFYPPGWKREQMMAYSRKNLKMAHQYMATLKQGTAAHIFCSIPLALAEATVTIIEQGLPKLSRQQVMEICKVNV